MRYLLALVFILAGIACSDTKNDAEVVSTSGAVSATADTATDGPTEVATDAPTDAPTDTPEPDVLNLSLGDTAEVGALRITANSFRTDPGGQLFQPDPGNVWVIVDVTVFNTRTDETYLLSTLLEMAVRDSEGREYDEAFGADTTGSLGGNIQPSDQSRGELAFEVPIGATGLQFEYHEAFGGGAARWNLQ